MNRIVLASTFALTLATTTVQASEFNLGIAFGYGTGSTRLQYRPGDAVYDQGYKGPAGGIFANYRRPVTEGNHPLILGLELAFDLSGLKSKVEAAHFLKQKHTLQGIFLVGTKVGDANLDLRFGYSHGQFEYKGSVVKRKKRTGGILIGLGASAQLAEHFSLGVVVDHTIFRRVNYKITTGGDDLDNEKTQTTVGKLRFAYRF